MRWLRCGCYVGWTLHHTLVVPDYCASVPDNAADGRYVVVDTVVTRYTFGYPHTRLLVVVLRLRLPFNLPIWTRSYLVATFTLPHIAVTLFPRWLIPVER